MVASGPKDNASRVDPWKCFRCDTIITVAPAVHNGDK